MNKESQLIGPMEVQRIQYLVCALQNDEAYKQKNGDYFEICKNMIDEIRRYFKQQLLYPAAHEEFYSPPSLHDRSHPLSMLSYTLPPDDMLARLPTMERIKWMLSILDLKAVDKVRVLTHLGIHDPEEQKPFLNTKILSLRQSKRPWKVDIPERVSPKNGSGYWLSILKSLLIESLPLGSSYGMQYYVDPARHLSNINTLAAPIWTGAQQLPTSITPVTLPISHAIAAGMVGMEYSRSYKYYDFLSKDHQGKNTHVCTCYRNPILARQNWSCEKLVLDIVNQYETNACFHALGAATGIIPAPLVSAYLIYKGLKEMVKRDGKKALMRNVLNLHRAAQVKGELKPRTVQYVEEYESVLKRFHGLPESMKHPFYKSKPLGYSFELTQMGCERAISIIAMLVNEDHNSAANFAVTASVIFSNQEQGSIVLAKQVEKHSQ